MKYGDALASVRHIMAKLKERDPSGKGLFAGDVHSALTDLTAWGYLHQEKGTGRRASRYTPIWSRLDSVRESPNTMGADSSVLANPNADVRESPNTMGDSVLSSANEDPATGTRSTDRSTGIDGHDSAEARATLGADAPSGAAALDGFDLLWRAYGLKKQKVEARRAFNKLSLDPDAHAAMLAAAEAWRSSWAAQGNPSAPRKSLATWLRDELYDCDPPKAYLPVVATKAKIPRQGYLAPTPMEIIDATVAGSRETVSLAISPPGSTEKPIEVSFDLRRADGTANEAGSEMLNRIIEATGVANAQDTEELLYRPFLLSRLDGIYKFSSAHPTPESGVGKPQSSRQSTAAPQPDG